MSMVVGCTTDVLDAGVAAVEAHWQTVIAIAIAASCGVWVAWRLMRPFIGRVVDACGRGGGGDDDSRLIQIEPAATDISADSAVKTEPRSH